MMRRVSSMRVGVRLFWARGGIGREDSVVVGVAGLLVVLIGITIGIGLTPLCLYVCVDNIRCALNDMKQIWVYSPSDDLYITQKYPHQTNALIS